MVRGRVLRDRKRLLPFEIIPVVEGDLSEKVLSGARNYRFRGEATLPQRVWVIGEEVNDLVEYLW